MVILTEPQKKVLKLVSSTPVVRDNFWVTGGTALAEFYLQHRYSEDIDFFTDKSEEDFRLYMRELQANAQREGIRFENRKPSEDFKTFFGAWAYIDGEKIKLDFAVDSPYRFKKPEFSADYGIQVENPIDLACGKVSALFDRAKPRDFVDVYFIHKNMYEMDDLLPWSKDKHGGMENYGLAASFDQARGIDTNGIEFPRMIREVDLEDLKKTFEIYKHRLMNEPFDAKPYQEPQK